MGGIETVGNSSNVSVMVIYQYVYYTMIHSTGKDSGRVPDHYCISIHNGVGLQPCDKEDAISSSTSLVALSAITTHCCYYGNSLCYSRTLTN